MLKFRMGKFSYNNGRAVRNLNVRSVIFGQTVLGLEVYSLELTWQLTTELLPLVCNLVSRASRIFRARGDNEKKTEAKYTAWSDKTGFRFSWRNLWQSNEIAGWLMVM